MPGFGVRDHAVIGLWHLSQRNRKRNKVSFTLDLIMPDDTPGLRYGEVGCRRNSAEESNQERLLSSNGGAATRVHVLQRNQTGGCFKFRVCVRGIWNWLT